MKISFYEPEERTSENNGGITLNWIEEFGWNANPFEKQIDLVAMHKERQEINLFFIKAKQYAVITGASGTGKTTLLLWTKQELAKHKDYLVHFHNAHLGVEQLRTDLADYYRSFFTRGKNLTEEELYALVYKKNRKKVVLLIDDVEDIAPYKETLDKLRALHVLLIFSTHKKLHLSQAQDELTIELGMRTAEEYAEILRARIQACGGVGIHPFTQHSIQHLAKEAKNTTEFLSLAQETAIGIALKKITLEDISVDEEDTLEHIEEEAKKRTTLPKRKTNYDELIESLSEDINDASKN